ncbi:MAG: PEP-CTERM sorting domain-containing protein, partial [Akkermansiaceae bacterium]
LQSAEAATVVTLYGPGARTTSTTPATPLGINLGAAKTSQVLDSAFSLQSIFAAGSPFITFTAGSDLTSASYSTHGTYFGSGFTSGAQAGSANYANISFDGNDGVYEAVGQFNFDGTGGGYLVAIARNDDSSALSISAGKAAIDAVPEPSAIALLALGAGALMLRRSRKAA